MVEKINKKVVIIGLLSGLILMLSGLGIHRYMVYVDAVELVEYYEHITLPNTFINESDVSEFSVSEIEQVLEEEMKNTLERVIQIHVGETTYEERLSSFDVTFSDDSVALAKQLVAIGKDLELFDQVAKINEATRYDVSFTYEYNETLVNEWLDHIQAQTIVEKIEPTFKNVSYGVFEVNEGQVGVELEIDTLKESIHELIISNQSANVSLSVEPNIIKQETDPALLKSVNTRVSTYTSYYDPTIDRAINVELATNKVDNILLMPGDEFSFENQVSPVIAANGYVDATIFLNGEATDGMGGGICQISSTIYNTTLLAGIIPTERRHHSLPVGYVPLGQDATMAEGYIDYRFVNTLDYPIYINAYANNGTLTIEFWSNEEALEGVTYVVRSVEYPYNEGSAADTTLYGYNDKNQLVYEQFLHTSIYKPYKVADEEEEEEVETPSAPELEQEFDEPSEDEQVEDKPSEDEQADDE